MAEISGTELTPSTQREFRGVSGRVRILEDVLVGFVRAHRGLLAELAAVEHGCGEFLADPELRDEGRRLLRSCFRIRERASRRLERMLERMEELNREAMTTTLTPGQDGWARRTREEFERGLESAERHARESLEDLLRRDAVKAALKESAIEADEGTAHRLADSQPEKRSFLQTLAEARGPDGEPLVERVSPAGVAGPQRAKLTEDEIVARATPIAQERFDRAVEAGECCADAVEEEGPDGT